MSFSLQISANILSWPRMCACCGDVADTYFRAATSHTKGKRVQHTTTKWWEVPWCSGCAQHSRWFTLSQKALAFVFVVGGVSLVASLISETHKIAAVFIGGICSLHQSGLFAQAVPGHVRCGAQTVRREESLFVTSIGKAPFTPLRSRAAATLTHSLPPTTERPSLMCVRFSRDYVGIQKIQSRPSSAGSKSLARFLTVRIRTVDLST